MRKILALDTATEACSAALFDGISLIERYQVAPREHNNLILPMIKSLLAEADWRMQDLEGLAFGAGPGSFTGVRIAAGVIQGLALGLDLRVVGVSTLAALAEAGMRDLNVDSALAAIDARMGQVYWGAYHKTDQGHVVLSGEEVVIDPSDVPMPSMTFEAGVGSGWGTYRDVLGERLGQLPAHMLPDRFPRAASIARLGFKGFRQGLDVAGSQAQPSYLRNEVAKKPGQRQ